MSQEQHNNYDVFGMKLCFIDNSWSERFSYYRDAMLQLEKDFPNKKFVWWTQALRPEWPSPQSCQNIQDFNNRVREFARANNKPLLDVADIENPTIRTGMPAPPVVSQPACSMQVTRTSPRMGIPAGQASIRIAKAFWWLMARITGWSGQSQ